MALGRLATLLAIRKPAALSFVSQRAIQLTKRLRFTRGFASNLHFALLRGRRRDCHERHMVNLRLDARVQMAAMDAQCQESSGFVPGLSFQMIQTGLGNKEERSCHEISVHVLNTGDQDDGEARSVHQAFQESRSGWSVTETPISQPAVTDVQDICGTLAKGHQSTPRTMFVLAAYQQLCTAAVEPPHRVILRKVDYPKVIRLKDLLTVKGSVPLKYRCFLALKLSSSILQLMETPWLKTWQFLDVVCFPVKRNHDDEGFSIDFDYPTVSVLTTAARSSLSSHRQVDTGAVLLEFGIVLLELWHEEILEDHFSCQPPVASFQERRNLAMIWFDEMQNPLPPLYSRAASHCIRGTVGHEPYWSDWEDNEFWNSFCRNVIEPLHKNCGQWMREEPWSRSWQEAGYVEGTILG